MSGPPVVAPGPPPNRTAAPTITRRQKGLRGSIAGVDAALAGYQSGLAEDQSALEIYLGSQLAGLSGFAAAGPIGAVVAAATYIFGAVRGASKRRKEEKRAANIEVVTGQIGAIPLPYLYGYCKVQPIPVYFTVGNTIGQSATAYQGGFGGLFTTSLGDPSTKTIQGGDEALALQQYDLCAGGVAELIDVIWRGQSIRDNSSENLFRLRSFMKLYQPGVAGDFASLFVPHDEAAENLRTANTTFLGKAHLDANYWQWYKTPIFDDQVLLDEAYLHGDFVRRPVKSGSTYSLGAAVKSRNTFAVALDYLLSTSKGPQGITVDDIDLASVYDCYKRAEVLLGADAAGSAGGDVDASTLSAQCRDIVLSGGWPTVSNTAKSVPASAWRRWAGPRRDRTR